MRPNWISTSALNLLRKIDQATDKEITFERGAGWWVDYRKVRSRLVDELHDMTLISLVMGKHDDDYRVYKISPDGEETLRDPSYEPRIVQARRDELRRRL